MKSSKILQDDEDFLVEVVNWHGRPAARKSTTPTTEPRRLKQFKNEVYGLYFFADLADSRPDLGLYIPDLYEVGDGYIVTEYIDKPAVGDNPRNLDKLAKLLADIDRIEPFGEARITPHYDYQNIRLHFSQWTKVALEAGTLTAGQLDTANMIIDKYEPFLRPRIAHGDLSPFFHAFMMDESKIAWLDLEVFTPRGARYYDVVRCYARLYQSAGSVEIARKFLSSFLGYADKVPRRDEQLIAIFAQRVVGMQRDAVVDATKGEDYKQRASELLNLVLEDKLELLHD